MRIGFIGLRPEPRQMVQHAGHAARLTCLNKVSMERQPMSCIWMFAIFLEHVLDIALYQLDICGQICVCACILKTGCHWSYYHATHTHCTTPFFQKLEFTGMLWFEMCYQWTLQHFLRTYYDWLWKIAGTTLQPESARVRRRSKRSHTCCLRMP